MLNIKERANKVKEFIDEHEVQICIGTVYVCGAVAGAIIGSKYTKHVIHNKILKFAIDNDRKVSALKTLCEAGEILEKEKGDVPKEIGTKVIETIIEVSNDSTEVLSGIFNYCKS